jgi:mannose-6-phosphate isomerase-like protein (cupin superfamily)
MALSELSEKAGFSVSFLSLVERGKSSLSITSLKKVADALQAPMSQFLPAGSPNGALVHKAGESHSALVLGKPQVVYEVLSSANPERRLEPMIVTHHPLAADEPDPEPYGHAGEEFCYVLEGELTFRIGDETHVVRAGDSIHFDSTVPHVCVNRSRRPVRSLWVLTPKLL